MSGDKLQQTFFLAAGTYTMTVYARTQNNLGQITWYVDGTAVVSGQDWYASSNGAGSTIATSGVTVNRNGNHTLKSVATGKNASSSGYCIAVTKVWFR